jgi:hypothetical protein
MAENDNRASGDRNAHRDNDDVRNPLADNDRVATKADSKSEARGDARENIGNTARGAAANPSGPEGNDKTTGRARPDSFDSDLDSVGG